MDSNVTKARKKLQKLEAEQERILSGIRAELDKAQSSNRPQSVIEGLQNRLTHQQSLADRYIAYAREAVKEAEKGEHQQGLISEVRRLVKERDKKELALKHWRKAGGSAADFEAAWPEMNRKMLQDEVMAELVNPPDVEPGNIFG